MTSNPLKTREDLQRAMQELCEPLRPYFSPGYARVNLGNSGAGHDHIIAELEAFSRVLWGLSPLLAGDIGYDLAEWFTLGIINGTNPAHEEYWGEASDYNQRLVEMAAIALSLVLAPKQFWSPLSEQEKQNLVVWLSQANKCKVYDCNWLFFPIIVNLGLKAVGAAYDSGLIENNLERLEQFYVSDGWFTDGVGGHSDYYIPYAIHFYSLLYAKLMEKEDPARSALYKERAILFAESFIHWFAADGSALPYGRSLTYRFAQAAFWSAAVYAGIEPFSQGVMKGILLRHFRYWFKQPIFHQDGTLSVGYSYPNLVMAENYNAPGSPYWALKTFLILALPEDHAFWLAEEEPLPALKERSIQQVPHLVFERQGESGHVLAFNSGHIGTNEHTHTSAKYEKFVYSTFFGFSVPRAEWGLGQGAYDSMLALSEGDNHYRVKRKSEETWIASDSIYTKWKPWADVTVDTWLVPGSPWHVRVHCIRTGRPLHAAEGGFSIGLTSSSQHTDVAPNLPPDVNLSKDKLLFQLPSGASGVLSLLGGMTPELIYPNANTNVIHSRTALPTLVKALEPGVHLLVSAIYGEVGSQFTRSSWEKAPCARIEAGELIIQTADLAQILFRKKIE